MKHVEYRSSMPVGMHCRLHPVHTHGLLTFCSCVGVWERGRVKTIRMLDGANTLPSCVSFTRLGKRFGRAAKENVRCLTTCHFVPMPSRNCAVVRRILLQCLQ